MVQTLSNRAETLVVPQALLHWPAACRPQDGYFLHFLMASENTHLRNIFKQKKKTALCRQTGCWLPWYNQIVYGSKNIYQIKMWQAGARVPTSLAFKNSNYCTLNTCGNQFSCFLISCYVEIYIHMQHLSVLSELRINGKKNRYLLFLIIISESPAVLFSCTAAVNGGVTLQGKKDLYPDRLHAYGCVIYSIFSYFYFT